MPITKYYFSENNDSERLEVYHDSDNLCTLDMRNEATNQTCLTQLTIYDLTDLINELIYIKKQIESKEEYNELH